MKEEIKVIENIMNEVCGGNWWDDGIEMTEEDFEKVCERCPYCGKCRESGLMWGCPNWEESMGEDL